MRVLVTRPAGQADGLIEALSHAGLDALHLPMLQIKAVSGAALDDVKDHLVLLQQADLAIFVSSNAVHYTAQVLHGLSVEWPAGLNCLAIGTATHEAIARQQWPLYNELRDGDRTVAALTECGKAQDSEALLARPILQDVKGWCIVLLRGRGGRTVLAEQLQQRGAQVDSIETYQRQRPAYSPEQLGRRLDEFLQPASLHTDHVLDQDCAERALIFASGETLDNFCAYLKQLGREQQFSDIATLVPSERVAKQARAYGQRNVHVAGNASKEAFLQALEKIQANNPD